MSAADANDSPSTGSPDSTKTFLIAGAVVVVVVLAVIAAILTVGKGDGDEVKAGARNESTGIVEGGAANERADGKEKGVDESTGTVQGDFENPEDGENPAAPADDKDASDKVGGASAARNAVQEDGPVKVTGDPLPAYPDSVASVLANPKEDPAVGRKPPRLEGSSFDGTPLVIDPADGRAKVIVFVAHWCPHCQKEVPKIQKWIDDGNKPADVDFYGVSTAVDPSRPNYPPSKWIAGEGFTPPVLLDGVDSNAAGVFGLTGFPYLVALNADGTVAQRGAGEVPTDDLTAMVKSLKR